MTDNMLDVLVVGAGQAGLAIGYYLAQQRSEFLIIDGAQEVGHSWRSRWDSLVLFTPAQFDNLPGMAFPAEADTYPTKDDAASYLGGAGARALARRHGLHLRSRVRSVDGPTVTFSDGTSFDPASIVWATGFRPEYGWIDVAGVLDPAGRPVHRRGVTSAEGFYFLGLTWLWTRGSALLGWVGDDASYLAGQIAAFRGT
jgi:putative flavoprotein involved in K+ transport